MKTIAIANQKGGVAKTTTAIAIGYGLALKGYRTLLVDLDPQGSLTGFLGIDTMSRPTVFELLGIQRKNRAEFKDVVISIADKLDLIPADISLEEAVKLLTGEPTAAVCLAAALRRIKDKYDYCIIDTSPSLSVITVNAFAAAERVIVPIKPEEAFAQRRRAFARNYREYESLKRRRRRLSRYYARQTPQKHRPNY
ncbi:MAG: AAA family ATPase [Clostridiales bacterium]|jgi:chromosome partitioning protein|nr:AAA family ATPase [Clostridiales bacterium]